MTASKLALIYALLTCTCVAEDAHEYLRVQGDKVPFFKNLPAAELPVMKTGSDTTGTLDVNRIRKSVFDLVVYTRDEHGIEKISSFGTAFALQIEDDVFLAGCHHVLRNAVAPLFKFAVLVKGEDGVWFHVEKFQGVCDKTDFILMKPSRVLPVSFVLTPFKSKPLDTLYTCGRLGRFSAVFRKGELMAREESFLLTSLAAGQGSSGSPVFDEKGLLVGMVTEVLPLMRESGLYSGDHFAESVITKCRAFE